MAAFFITSLFPPNGNAASDLPVSVPESSGHAGQPLELPPDLGTIQDRFHGKTGRLVVLIQDAHAIPDAQRNIQKLIEFFRAQYGIKLTAFEGASSALDSRFFKSFPDREKLKKIIEEYYDRGEMSGVMASDLLSDGGRTAGIENWDLYQEGLGYFQNALKTENAILEKLARFRAQLQKRKEAAYSPELLEIDRILELFESSHDDFTGVLQRLSKIMKPLEGSELALILEESQKADDTGIRSEVQALARQIMKIPGFSKEDVIRWNEAYQNFQTSQSSPEDFASWMMAWTAEKQMKVRYSDALLGRIERRSKLQNLEGTKFFSEWAAYTQQVKKRLLRNEEERRLDQDSRDLRLLEKWAKLELSRPEWSQIQDLRARQDGPFISVLRDFSEAHELFYRNALKREKVFTEKMETLFITDPSVVLVTGGFHQEGLTKHFRDEGVSYVLVSPQVQALPKDHAYRGIMQGKVSWRGYYRTENGKVNLYAAFVRAMRDRLIPDTSPKLWRDQIIRDLSRQGNIDQAHRYTAFLDETAEGQNDFRPDWESRLDRFIQGLQKLEADKKLTEQNILKLLQPAASLMSAPVPLAPNASLTKPLAFGEGVELAGSPKSEFRSEEEVNKTALDLKPFADSKADPAQRSGFVDGTDSSQIFSRYVKPSQRHPNRSEVRGADEAGLKESRDASQDSALSNLRQILKRVLYKNWLRLYDSDENSRREALWNLGSLAAALIRKGYDLDLKIFVEKLGDESTIPTAAAQVLKTLNEALIEQGKPLVGIEEMQELAERLIRNMNSDMNAFLLLHIIETLTVIDSKLMRAGKKALSQKILDPIVKADEKRTVMPPETLRDRLRQGKDIHSGEVNAISKKDLGLIRNGKEPVYLPVLIQEFPQAFDAFYRSQSLRGINEASILSMIGKWDAEIILNGGNPQALDLYRKFLEDPDVRACRGALEAIRKVNTALLSQKRTAVFEDTIRALYKSGRLWVEDEALQAVVDLELDAIRKQKTSTASPFVTDLEKKILLGIPQLGESIFADAKSLRQLHAALIENGGNPDAAEIWSTLSGHENELVRKLAQEAKIYLTAAKLKAGELPEPAFYDREMMSTLTASVLYEPAHSFYEAFLEKFPFAYDNAGALVSQFWLQYGLPFSDEFLERYFDYPDAETFLKSLRTQALKAIEEGFNPMDKDDKFLAFLGVRLSDFQVSWEEFNDRLNALIWFDKTHDNSKGISPFQRLFQKGKSLKPLDISASGVRELDLKGVDEKEMMEDLDHHFKTLKTIKAGVDDFSWLQAFSNLKVFSIRNLYFLMKRSEAETKGLIKAGERFRVEIPEDPQKLKEEILSDKKAYYRAAFSLLLSKSANPAESENCFLKMRDLVVSEILEDPVLTQQLSGGILESRIPAFKMFYEDFVRHLPANAGHPLEGLPKLRNALKELSAPFYRQAAKAHYVMSAERRHFALVPAGFLSVFHGRAGIVDCSFDMDKGSAFTRAMQEDTEDYLIYSSQRLAGYVGLTWGKDSQARKILTIDTIQSPIFDGEELITHLLTELHQFALEKGAAGLALPRDLANQFNFDNRETVGNLKMYREGEPIEITPLHRKSWEEFTYRFGRIGADQFIGHSMDSGEFVLLLMPDTVNAAEFSFAKGKRMAVDLIQIKDWTPAEAARFLELINQPEGFSWKYKEWGTDEKEIINGGRGLEGLVRGFHHLGSLNRWSLMFHAENQKGRGDLTGYLMSLFEQIPELKSFRRYPHILRDSSRLNNSEKVKRDLEALGFAEGFLEELQSLVAKRSEMRSEQDGGEAPDTVQSAPIRGPSQEAAEAFSKSEERMDAEVEAILKEHPALEREQKRWILQELIRHFGSAAALKGKKGLEFGPGEELSLLRYLNGKAKAHATGIGRSFGSPTGNLTLESFIRFTPDYNDYLKDLPDGFLDFLIADASLYLYRYSQSNETDRVEVIRKHYEPISRVLADNAIVVMTHYPAELSEDQEAPSDEELRALGLELVRRYPTGPKSSNRVVTVLKKSTNVPGALSYAERQKDFYRSLETRPEARAEELTSHLNRIIQFLGFALYTISPDWDRSDQKRTIDSWGEMTQLDDWELVELLIEDGKFDSLFYQLILDFRKLAALAPVSDNREHFLSNLDRYSKILFILRNFYQILDSQAQQASQNEFGDLTEFHRMEREALEAEFGGAKAERPDLGSVSSFLTTVSKYLNAAFENANAISTPYQLQIERLRGRFADFKTRLERIPLTEENRRLFKAACAWAEAGRFWEAAYYLKKMRHDASLLEHPDFKKISEWMDSLISELKNRGTPFAILELFKNLFDGNAPYGTKKALFEETIRKTYGQEAERLFQKMRGSEERVLEKLKQMGKIPQFREKLKAGEVWELFLDQNVLWKSIQGESEHLRPYAIPWMAGEFHTLVMNYILGESETVMPDFLRAESREDLKSSVQKTAGEKLTEASRAEMTASSSDRRREREKPSNKIWSFQASSKTLNRELALWTKLTGIGEQSLKEAVFVHEGHEVRIDLNGRIPQEKIMIDPDSKISLFYSGAGFVQAVSELPLETVPETYAAKLKQSTELLDSAENKLRAAFGRNSFKALSVLMQAEAGLLELEENKVEIESETFRKELHRQKIRHQALDLQAAKMTARWLCVFEMAAGVAGTLAARYFLPPGLSFKTAYWSMALAGVLAGFSAFMVGALFVHFVERRGERRYEEENAESAKKEGEAKLTLPSALFHSEMRSSSVEKNAKDLRRMKWLSEAESRQLVRDIVTRLAVEPDPLSQALLSKVSYTLKEERIIHEEGEGFFMDSERKHLPLLYIERIGPFIFILLDEDSPELLPFSIRTLRHQLDKSFKPYSGNILITTAPAYTRLSGTRMGSHLVKMIAAMLDYRDQFQNKTVVDFGAGNGILSRIALAMGARKAVLIERDREELKKASLLMTESGWTRGWSEFRDFTTFHADLNHPSTKAWYRRHGLPEKETIGISNIGPWTMYNETGFSNENVILEVSRWPGIQYLFNGGYNLEDHRRQYEEIVKHLQTNGFSVMIPDKKFAGRSEDVSLLIASRRSDGFKSAQPSSSLRSEARQKTAQENSFFPRFKRIGIFTLLAGGWIAALSNVVLTTAHFAMNQPEVLVKFLPVIFHGWILIATVVLASHYQKRPVFFWGILLGGVFLAGYLFPWQAGYSLGMLSWDILLRTLLRAGVIYAGVYFADCATAWLRGERNLKMIFRQAHTSSLRWALSIGLIGGYFIYCSFLPFIQNEVPANFMRSLFDLGVASPPSSIPLTLLTGIALGEGKDLLADFRELHRSKTLKAYLIAYPINFLYWFPVLWLYWWLVTGPVSLLLLHNAFNFIWMALFKPIVTSALDSGGASVKTATPPASEMNTRLEPEENGGRPRAEGRRMESSAEIGPSLRSVFGDEFPFETMSTPRFADVFGFDEEDAYQIIAENGDWQRERRREALLPIVRARLWDPLLREIDLSENAQARILDLGVGAGFELEVFPEHLRRNLLALDLNSKALIESAKRYPGISLARRDWLQTGFPDESFDAIVSMDIMGFEQLGGNDEFYKKMTRILRPGGSFNFLMSILPSIEVARTLFGLNFNAWIEQWEKDRIAGRGESDAILIETFLDEQARLLRTLNFSSLDRFREEGSFYSDINDATTAMSFVYGLRFQKHRSVVNETTPLAGVESTRPESRLSLVEPTTPPARIGNPRQESRLSPVEPTTHPARIGNPRQESRDLMDLVGGEENQEYLQKAAALIQKHLPKIGKMIVTLNAGPGADISTLLHMLPMTDRFILVDKATFKESAKGSVSDEDLRNYVSQKQRYRGMASGSFLRDHGIEPFLMFELKLLSGIGVEHIQEPEPLEGESNVHVVRFDYQGKTREIIYISGMNVLDQDDRGNLVYRKYLDRFGVHGKVHAAVLKAPEDAYQVIEDESAGGTLKPLEIENDLLPGGILIHENQRLALATNEKRKVTVLSSPAALNFDMAPEKLEKVKFGYNTTPAMIYCLNPFNIEVGGRAENRGNPVLDTDTKQEIQVLLNPLGLLGQGFKGRALDSEYDLRLPLYPFDDLTGHALADRYEAYFHSWNPPLTYERVLHIEKDLSLVELIFDTLLKSNPYSAFSMPEKIQTELKDDQYAMARLIYLGVLRSLSKFQPSHREKMEKIAAIIQKTQTSFRQWIGRFKQTHALSGGDTSSEQERSEMRSRSVNETTPPARIGSPRQESRLSPVEPTTPPASEMNTRQESRLSPVESTTPLAGVENTRPESRSSLVDQTTYPFLKGQKGIMNFSMQDHYLPPDPHQISLRNNAMQDLADETEAAIETKISGSLPNPKPDLFPILTHLIPNAIDAVYARIDSGDLALSDGKIQFQVRFDPLRQHVNLVLNDEGTGISPHVMKGWSLKTPRHKSTKLSKAGYFIGSLGESMIAAFDHAKGKAELVIRSKQKGESALRLIQYTDGRRELMSDDKETIGTEIILSVPRMFPGKAVIQGRAEMRQELTPAVLRLRDYFPAEFLNRKIGQVIFVADNTGTLALSYNDPLNAVVEKTLENFLSLPGTYLVVDSGDPVINLESTVYRSLIDQAQASRNSDRFHFVTDSGTHRKGFGKNAYDIETPHWNLETQFDYVRGLAEYFYEELLSRPESLKDRLKDISDEELMRIRNDYLAELDRMGPQGFGRQAAGKEKPGTYHFHLLPEALEKRFVPIYVYAVGAKVTLATGEKDFQFFSAVFMGAVYEKFMRRFKLEQDAYLVFGDGFIDLARESKQSGGQKTLDEKVYPHLNQDEVTVIFVMGDNANDIPMFSLKPPAHVKNAVVIPVFLNPNPHFANSLPEKTFVTSSENKTAALEGTVEFLKFLDSVPGRRIGDIPDFSALQWKEWARPEHRTVNEPLALDEKPLMKSEMYSDFLKPAMEWTDEKLVLALQTLDREKVPVFLYAISRDKSERTSALLKKLFGVDLTGADVFFYGRRRFGSWNKVLKLAGIDAKSMRQTMTWSASRLIHAVRVLYLNRVSLNPSAMAKDYSLRTKSVLMREFGMPISGHAVFNRTPSYIGDWDKALTDADLDPQFIRSEGAMGRWKKSRPLILEALAVLFEKGIDLNSAAIRKDRSPRTKEILKDYFALGMNGDEVWEAGKNMFGSWQNALKVFGFGSGEIPQYAGEPWKNEQITQTLHALNQKGISLSFYEIQRNDSPEIRAITQEILGIPLSGRGFYHVAVSWLHFGNWDAALRSAGLNTREIRKKFFKEAGSRKLPHLTADELSEGAYEILEDSAALIKSVSSSADEDGFSNVFLGLEENAHELNRLKDLSDPKSLPLFKTPLSFISERMQEIKNRIPLTEAELSRKLFLALATLLDFQSETNSENPETPEESLAEYLTKMTDRSIGKIRIFLRVPNRKTRLDAINEIKEGLSQLKMREPSFPEESLTAVRLYQERMTDLMMHIQKIGMISEDDLRQYSLQIRRAIFDLYSFFDSESEEEEGEEADNEKEGSLSVVRNEVGSPVEESLTNLVGPNTVTPRAEKRKLHVEMEFEMDAQKHLYPYQLMETLMMRLNRKLGGPGIQFGMAVRENGEWRPLEMKALSLLAEGEKLMRGSRVRLNADTEDARISEEQLMGALNILKIILTSSETANRNVEASDYRDRRMEEVDDWISKIASVEQHEIRSGEAVLRRAEIRRAADYVWRAVTDSSITDHQKRYAAWMISKRGAEPMTDELIMLKNRIRLAWNRKMERTLQRLKTNLAEVTGKNLREEYAVAYSVSPETSPAETSDFMEAVISLGVIKQILLPPGQKIPEVWRFRLKEAGIRITQESFNRKPELPGTQAASGIVTSDKKLPEMLGASSVFIPILSSGEARVKDTQIAKLVIMLQTASAVYLAREAKRGNLLKPELLGKLQEFFPGIGNAALRLEGNHWVVSSDALYQFLMSSLSAHRLLAKSA